ncbi:Putative transcription initiation factor IIF, beta subunit, TFIIF beta subunit, HTH [Septoria linicola]|uniref:Transcription initiation factor IIF subunit beta n=1 Tax=Septoria linicola TaxID=215465 RepID=A0A9Q9AH53_9PEZI|nr:putative transcription initiation factor IIF, beta subunit, TFIIF beta subunit, HTH [Septoria linicola]USW47559.1 Putative transcription initiation factor IIF, beta subunit, TFIIF beta subunit, HTH [Septoria linicola]
MADVKAEVQTEERKPALGEIDEFEEDTDLHIPDGGQAWLLKVSEDMWKVWNQVYQEVADDAQLEIGRVRVFHPPPPSASTTTTTTTTTNSDDPSRQKIQIRLHDAIPHHKPLPKTYNVELKSQSYNNTVVFSEKDLPGHNTTTRPNRPPPAAQRPGGINKYDRYNNQQPRKPGSYRTAIPKQTALAPTVHNEADMHPVEDKSSLDYFAQTYRSALQAGNKTIFTVDPRLRHPGQDNDSFRFGTLTSKVGAGNKKKPAKEKAVRMDKAALLDALKDCFKEYTYWSLKALRQRLRQPEAYIKETLDDIATLMRQGDFVQNYKLKPEYKLLLEQEGEDMSAVKEEQALTKLETTDEGTGDEMDEDDDFEDVKME